jgi:hypothetical protein
MILTPLEWFAVLALFAIIGVQWLVDWSGK